MTGLIDPDQGFPPQSVIGDQDRSMHAASLGTSLRWLGLAMRGFGWSGLVMAAFLLISMPFLLHRFQMHAMAELQSLGGSLRTASGDLASQRATLDELDGLLEKAAGLSGDIDDSLIAVTPLLDDMATFLGDQMPVTLESTELSLRSASDGAAAIDSLLRLLSRIPFLGIIEYDPTQPLDASLVQAANGIAPLGAPLIELQVDLNQFSDVLNEMHPEIGSTELALDDFRGELAGLRKAIKTGGETLGSLASSVEQIEARLPGTIIGAGLLLGWSLLWFALVNAVLIIQGMKLVRHAARL